ncbi:dihydrodipicolinate synthase family protein [Xanthobacter sediminis]
MTESTTPDRLWVPALTHYRLENGTVALDSDRTRAHIRAVQPEVRQFLLAGSTGDGWQMTLDQVREVAALTGDAETFAGTRFLVGALRPETADVVAFAVEIERVLAGIEGAGTFAGLAVCPPVDEDASQARIEAHYEAVLAATRGPVAVYQLPQVTKCRIAHATLAKLARNPRVTLFKDTSGEDTVAKAGPIAGVTYVRGAEGGYLDALKPLGPYDGWLLSTGNVFGRELRRILDLHAAGEEAEARRLSAVLTEVVEALFAAAVPLPFGNPFSNANRAADHVLAYGPGWRTAPRPLTITGDAIPETLLEVAETLLERVPDMRRAGYLTRQG